MWKSITRILQAMMMWIKTKQYYKLLIILLFIFLLLYNRILRYKTIKYLDILTAYDIQLYLCLSLISLTFIIYQFVKLTTNLNGISFRIVQYFKEGLTELDQYLKTNSKVKQYLTSFSEYIIRITEGRVYLIKLTYFIFDILPRYLVVFFLFYDVFYNNKIQYFYKCLPLLFIPLLLLFIEITIKNVFIEGCKRIDTKILIQKNTNDVYKEVISVKDYVHQEVLTELSKTTLHVTITPSFEFIKMTINNKNIAWDKTLLKFKNYLKLLCKTYKILYLYNVYKYKYGSWFILGLHFIYYICWSNCL